MEQQAQIVTPIPIEIRKQFALRYFSKTAVVAAVIAGFLIYFDSPLDAFWLCIFPLAWGLVVAFKYLLTKEYVEITEYGKEVEEKLNEEKLRQAQEREDKWYVRYPMAILFLALAWWLLKVNEELWWASIFFVVVAAVSARELSLIALLCLGGYLLFIGVAALPVSVAVIVGALIIASAIKK